MCKLFAQNHLFHCLLKSIFLDYMEKLDQKQRVQENSKYDGFQPLVFLSVLYFLFKLDVSEEQTKMQ